MPPSAAAQHMSTLPDSGQALALFADGGGRDGPHVLRFEPAAAGCDG
jgi:hypothetical protein